MQSSVDDDEGWAKKRLMKTTRGVEHNDGEDKAMKTMMMRKHLWNNDCEYGDDGVSRSNEDYDDYL